MPHPSTSKVLWTAIFTGLIAGGLSGAILKFLIGGDHAVVAAGVAGGVVGVVVTNMTAHKRELEANARDGEG